MITDLPITEFNFQYSIAFCVRAILFSDTELQSIAY